MIDPQLFTDAAEPTPYSIVWRLLIGGVFTISTLIVAAGIVQLLTWAKVAMGWLQ